MKHALTEVPQVVFFEKDKDPITSNLCAAVKKSEEIQVCGARGHLLLE